jgi:hypothetical protein
MGGAGRDLRTPGARQALIDAIDPHAVAELSRSRLRKHGYAGRKTVVNIEDWLRVHGLTLRSDRDFGGVMPAESVVKPCIGCGEDDAAVIIVRKVGYTLCANCAIRRAKGIQFPLLDERPILEDPGGIDDEHD